MSNAHPGSYGGNDDYELVAEFDASESYEFDHYGVWRRKSDGRVFFDHDSHCSCYGDYESGRVGDMRELDATTFRSFRDELHGWYGWERLNANEAAASLDAVRRAVGS